ncbi:MAG: YdeI/OmpD-associated family protein [Streptococcaceae bacterium]|nr:YdeI/OmpD-associated family protein [Streptococcaceae bacterium]
MVKTLVEKLNLNKFNNKLVLNLPDSSYLSDLTNCQYADEKNSYDLIITFVTNPKEFTKSFAKYRNKISPDGLYVVAYPKVGNKKFSTSIHRDELFDLLKINPDSKIVADSTLKFNRMVALDEIYTVIAIKNIASQKTGKTSAASQRVTDYTSKLPELRQLLTVPISTDSTAQANHLELTELAAALDYFDSLTPGYQRDWARYIYSAKQSATQEKRKDEFLSAMTAKIKTSDLYKKSLKK